MKINRFIALAALALLVVGAMGAISYRALAASNATASAQEQNCDQQDDDSAEVADAADTDNVEEQCGDQNAPDDEEEMEAESAGEEDVEAAPSGTPAITAKEAQAAALKAQSGTIVQTELDDENGQLVYSVEFDGGVDVKVDAMTGDVLGTETGQD